MRHEPTGGNASSFGTCLLLAFKVSEAQETTVEAREVVAELEARFDVTRAELLKAEFPVMAHLGFSLNVPPTLVAPHLERLLQSKGSSPVEYLGEALHRRHVLLCTARISEALASAIEEFGDDLNEEDEALLRSIN